MTWVVVIVVTDTMDFGIITVVEWKLMMTMVVHSCILMINGLLATPFVEMKVRPQNCRINSLGLGNTSTVVLVDCRNTCNS